MKAFKRIGKTFQIIILIFFIGSVYGQNENINVTKDEIINKAWKAMFGELKPADIESIYVEGLFHGSKVPNKMTLKRPNLFRNEVSSGVLVFDGKQAAWVERTPDKEGNPRNPEMIDTASWRHFEIDIALIFPAFFEYPSEFKGMKNYEGYDAYELFVELPLGGKITYFIDPKSFLVNRRMVDWDGDNREAPWENLIDTYINYNGIIFPDGYTYDGRNGKEKGIYENFKVNIKPNSELFIIPEGIN